MLAVAPTTMAAPTDNRAIIFWRSKQLWKPWHRKNAAIAATIFVQNRAEVHYGSHCTCSTSIFFSRTCNTQAWQHHLRAAKSPPNANNLHAWRCDHHQFTLHHSHQRNCICSSHRSHREPEPSSSTTIVDHEHTPQIWKSEPAHRRVPAIVRFQLVAVRVTSKHGSVRPVEFN